MTAALGPLITHHPTVKTEMETFLVQHVLPCFSASEGYLRAMVRPRFPACSREGGADGAQACEVVGTLEKGGLEWSGEEVLSQHFQVVAAAMNDPDLPVQVHAALALTAFIENHQKGESSGDACLCRGLTVLS
jgi:hypothetical protein